MSFKISSIKDKRPDGEEGEGGEARDDDDSSFGDEGGILVAELELAGKDLAENFVLGIALAAAATADKK